VLSTGCTKNPVCIIANYLFDTLCHDIFQVDGGELREGLVSVGSRNAEEPDPLDPEIIQRLENAYKYERITPDYYTDEEGDEPYLQLILNWYKDYFRNTASGASFLLPIGALRALRRLATFSTVGTVVISGDKGNNSPDQFIGIVDPYIAVHGSFSLMVNYHAVGLWVTSKGGFALHNPQEEASLKVSCFVLPATAPEKAPSASDFVGDAVECLDADRSSAYKFLALSFRETCVMFGPNDFFVLQKSLKEDVSSPSLRSVVSMLKLSDWDPDVFFKFRDVILSQSPSCGSKLRNDIARGIPRLWSNNFVLDSDKDIAFEIGRFYYGVRDYGRALQFYDESVSTVGEHHITLHNQGLCYYSQGKLETSLSYFSRSLSLNSLYEKARNWIDKVNKEIESGKKSTQTVELVEGEQSSAAQ
jgi:tetratricopeptide (TPR) repeat protein